MALEHGLLSYRAATPSFREKKKFAAMKMDVQKRANLRMIGDSL